MPEFTLPYKILLEKYLKRAKYSKMMNYPTHIGIIPDGCRRWAEEKGVSSLKGHAHGIEILEGIGRWSLRELPIKYYTVYGLSFENLNRPKEQLKYLSKLYAQHFLKLAEDEDVHNSKVSIGVVGKREMLPEEMNKAIDVALEATKDYNQKFFRIALAYGGRNEIVDAVNKILEQGGEVTVDNISKNVYSVVPEPDLIIRSAEQRLSNFLLWQSAYSEVYFTNKYWPDFTLEDYKNALKDYSDRKRRFGK
jgi:tritrans,polycis-undecaprenyl-diphosphate synthase [geranylgeranyl-diphosphate specific]